MMTCCFEEKNIGDSCLEYIYIKNIKSHSDEKLSKSYGNINFADFWLETVEDNFEEVGNKGKKQY